MTDLPVNQAAPVRRHLTRDTAATDVALVATFAALVAACAMLTIAVGAVPITLQTFAVLLTGAVLVPRRALLALGLYLAIGLAGVPVFSGGRTGLMVLAGPSVGYVVSFPVAAAVVGLLVGRIPARIGGAARTVGIFAACVAATVAVVYPLGIAGMAWRLDLTVGEAFVANATFIPGDLLKCAAAAVTAAAVLRAFPGLQRRS
ncbi:biotin transporter BioY [Sanguibacter suarezii]|uniref:biotin transporter BioY n=1 Tax=Sanguibacter suarezii TaxID=60921 RepID=UPI0008362626|nr:biotin transporter BioY [Sanguibacter suarezii]